MQKWHRTPRTAGQLGRLLDLGVQPSLGRVDSLGLLANLGVGFSPFGLFADGSQGVWYDPSDLSTLFQDAAGTTPVTAVEQPVRLMLDKSRGAGPIGPDTVINGTFAVDADWTKGTDWTIGSGVATKTAGTAAVLSQAQTLVAGRTYVLTYTITRTAGTLTAQFTGGTTVSGTGRTAAGTYADVLQAVTGNTTLEFSAGSTFAGTVDDVTLVVLPLGNHATASADARRPVLSARVNLLDATTTLATQSVTVVAASHTLSFTGTGTITLTGASTAGPLVGTGVGQRVSLAFTPTAGSLTLTVSGTVTDADLRVTNDGVGLPVYQRVTTSTDYDTAGFPRYLRFDGTDDSMATAAFAWGSGNVTTCMGVRRLGPLNTFFFLGAFGNAGIANNSWGVASGPFEDRTGWYNIWRTSAANGEQARVPGIVSTDVDTRTIDCTGATSVSDIRLNRVGGSTITTTTGPTTFGTYAFELYGRNGTASTRPSRIYQAIGVNKTLSAVDLANTEAYVNDKTKAY
jgi:hypothetical protein